MGAATAGANMGKSAEEGQKLLDNFFKTFTGLKQAIEDSKKSLRENEYVEDFLGRRRRLPEINLPPYTVELKKKQASDFNPFIGCSNRTETDPKVIKWQNRLTEEINKSVENQRKRFFDNEKNINKQFVPKKEISNKVYDKLVKEAANEGVVLHANTGRIAQAERQCFNARIQGSAASLSKLAMIDIYNDELLNKYQAKLIIPVHDELLVECPEFYADLVEKRLPEVMINAAKKGGDNVPQACDPYNVKRWYADVAAATILDEFNKLEASGTQKDEAINIILKDHTEAPESSILNVITGKTEQLEF